jgi:hypothetical protein
MNISLDKIAPPVAFVVIGFIMTTLGAIGVVPIGNPQPTISEPIFRAALVVVGILLILLGPLLVWREITLSNSKGQNIQGEKQPSPTPANNLRSTEPIEKLDDTTDPYISVKNVLFHNRPVAALIVTKGPDQGKWFFLTEEMIEIIVGRSVVGPNTTTKSRMTTKSQI